jgi:hypothetical protein
MLSLDSSVEVTYEFKDSGGRQSCLSLAETTIAMKTRVQVSGSETVGCPGGLRTESEPGVPAPH